jgi:hypothetical protein
MGVKPCALRTNQACRHRGLTSLGWLAHACHHPLAKVCSQSLAEANSGGAAGGSVAELVGLHSCMCRQRQGCSACLTSCPRPAA